MWECENLGMYECMNVGKESSQHSPWGRPKTGVESGANFHFTSHSPKQRRKNTKKETK